MLVRFGLQIARQRWTLRTISTWTPYISLQKQKDFLRVAQCVHELEGRPDRTNLSPNIFIVPEREPFPKDLQGQKFRVSHLRRAKVNGVLDAKIVAEFDDIGFVWNGKEDQTNQQWEENFEALRIYKSIHGKLNLPYSYEVKEGDTQWPQKVPSSSEWPQRFHGCNVETSKFRRAYRMSLLDALVVAKLDELGFVWDDNQHQWSLTMEALRTFKKIYGHLEVPQVFEVPEGDPEWPVHLWTMRLGLKVATIRRRQTKLTLEKRRELDALDFVWDAMKLHQHRILSALKTYKKKYDNLFVPQKFVVPQDDPDWPSDLANMHLGAIVKTLRSRKDSLSSEMKAKLDELGFEWSGKERRK
ncbi:hypothetical protein AC1031_002509 [Aphanomyces cochlioides]|nr:hypothetical protein AC1031_002509 [Aphanomyces cochlioides]